MEVTYRLNPDDVQAFQWHNFRTSATLRRSYHTALVMFPLLMLLLSFLAYLTGFGLFSSVIFLCVTSLFWVFQFPRTYRRRLMSATRKLLHEGRNELLQRSHHMSFDEGGLYVKTDLGESRLSWSAVERVEETEGHIFIYIGSLTAHVIPKWAFATRQQAEEFFQHAQGYQRKA